MFQLRCQAELMRTIRQELPGQLVHMDLVVRVLDSVGAVGLLDELQRQLHGVGLGDDGLAGVHVVLLVEADLDAERVGLAHGMAPGVRGGIVALLGCRGQRHRVLGQH